MATALVMMTDPGNPEANGRMVHLLKTAAGLRDAGTDTAIYLHGAAVNWASAFAERSDRFTQHYGELFDEVKPLIAGVCNFCSNVRFGQGEAVAELGLATLAGHREPLGSVVSDGDLVVTVRVFLVEQTAEGLFDGDPHLTHPNRSRRRGGRRGACTG